MVWGISPPAGRGASPLSSFYAPVYGFIEDQERRAFPMVVRRESFRSNRAGAPADSKR